MRDGVIFDLIDENGNILYHLFVLEGNVDNLSSIRDVGFLVSELREVSARADLLADFVEAFDE